MNYIVGRFLARNRSPKKEVYWQVRWRVSACLGGHLVRAVRACRALALAWLFVVGVRATVSGRLARGSVCVGCSEQAGPLDRCLGRAGHSPEAPLRHYLRTSAPQPQVTCATDTDNVNTVFQATKEIILKHNLAASGFVD